MTVSRRRFLPFALFVLLSAVLLLTLPSSSSRPLLAVVAAEETTGNCGDTDAGTGSCANPDADVDVTDDSEQGSSTAETTEPATTKTEEDPNCPSRDLIIRCAGKHLDKNGNNKLDREELESAIATLPWYARGILQILGSVDKMMKKCDVDGDGAIGMDYDMKNNGETCLATCFKRKAFRNSFFPDCE